MKKTTLCYLEKDDSYLMMYKLKRKYDYNNGKWVGVGGKFEPFENADTCVKREVFEETGYVLTDYQFRGIIEFRSNDEEDEDMYLYTATGFEGCQKDFCIEGDLAWKKKKDILNLELWPGDKYFLEPLLNGKEQMKMRLTYHGPRLVKVEKLDLDVNVMKASNIKSLHGFSDRKGGVSKEIYESLNLSLKSADKKENVLENWKRFGVAAGIDTNRLCYNNQVHGNKVRIVNKRNLVSLEDAVRNIHVFDADGLVTKDVDVPLVVFTADCVPVLLEDATNGVIGAVHAGWRGTVADIEDDVIKKMEEIGAKREDIHIAIGPAICKNCFEVGEEVIDAVKNLLSFSGFFEKKENGKFLLDLKGVVRERFKQLGVPDANIEIIDACTRCDTNRFWSHRFAKGQRGSQAAIIVKSGKN